MRALKYIDCYDSSQVQRPPCPPSPMLWSAMQAPELLTTLDLGVGGGHDDEDKSCVRTCSGSESQRTMIWSSGLVFLFHLRSPARDHLFCLSICVNMLLGMYVCMYVCMYVVCMSYVCTSVCICMCACMYALLNVCMCLYVCVYVCMRLSAALVNVCMYIVCAYVCMHLFMYVCMCVCVSIRPTLKPHETTTKPLTKPLDFCHTFDETSGFYKYYLYVQETYFSLERWFRRFVDKIRVVSWLVSWWFRVVSCISLEMRDNSLWVHVCTCVCV